MKIIRKLEDDLFFSAILSIITGVPISLCLKDTPIFYVNDNGVPAVVGLILLVSGILLLTGLIYFFRYITGDVEKEYQEVKLRLKEITKSFP